jgi:hypothetical protein
MSPAILRTILSASPRTPRKPLPPPRNVLYGIACLPATIADTSSSTVPIGLISNFSTSTPATAGDRKAGNVGDLVRGSDFENLAKRAIENAFRESWQGCIVDFTVEVQFSFLAIEINVGAVAITRNKLRVPPVEWRALATEVGTVALASGVKSLGPGNFIIFMQRLHQNNYELLAGFPDSQWAMIASEFISRSLCDLLYQIEKAEIEGKGMRRVNTAGLAEFLTSYFDLLIDRFDGLLRGLPLPG